MGSWMATTTDSAQGLEVRQGKGFGFEFFAQAVFILKAAAQWAATTGDTPL